MNDVDELTEGWQGKRYLLCSDLRWHLVLEIREGMVADTQCCEDVHVIQPQPESPNSNPLCETCAKIHFATSKTSRPG